MRRSVGLEYGCRVEAGGGHGTKVSCGSGRWAWDTSVVWRAEAERNIHNKMNEDMFS